MSDVDKKLIAIVGPTAVGKTAVGIELARSIGGEVISADSMQVYRGMDIGTEKPSPEERKGVPHHMIDVVDPRDPFSVALYQRLAREAIADIQKRDRWPILVGGTGLYVRAVIDPLEFPAGDHASEVRKRLRQRAEEEGGRALYEDLKRLDPEAARSIHPENTRRVIRALEVIELTGRSFSEFQRGWKVRKSIYQLRMFGLAMERSKLYARIDSRVNKQIEKGLLDEVRSLVFAGYEEFLTAKQALGYKELIEHINGICDLDEAVERLKRRTRNYAKRQMTWFKADPRVTWIDVTDRSAGDAVDEIKAKLEGEKFLDGRWRVDGKSKRIQ